MVKKYLKNMNLFNSKTQVKKNCKKLEMPTPGIELIQKINSCKELTFKSLQIICTQRKYKGKKLI